MAHEVGVMHDSASGVPRAGVHWAAPFSEAAEDGLGSCSPYSSSTMRGMDGPALLHRIRPIKAGDPGARSMVSASWVLAE